MKTLPKPVLCCGFTPCVQRIIEFARFEKSAVNRASRVTVGIGGKGANTARMVKQLGAEPVLIGFVGGESGALLEQMLDTESVGYRHVGVEGETRICQTLVEEGNPETTELVEEMPPLCPDDWRQMMKLCESLDLADAILAISGKLPAGAPVDAYAQICRVAHERGARVILDAPGEPLLLALDHEPALVKINDEELLASVGEDDVEKACKKLLSIGAGAVLITRGSRSALYVEQERSLKIIPPGIKAVNPVGSGDAVTAGLAVALSQGRDVEDAIRNGMACGAANALNLISGQLNPADVENLKPQVTMVQINH